MRHPSSVGVRVIIGADGIGVVGVVDGDGVGVVVLKNWSFRWCSCWCWW